MKAPYSFNEWIKREYGTHDPVNDDIAPELLYDGYVWSLMQLGYTVYGDCYKGITVKK
jgi:hypothetical protein